MPPHAAWLCPRMRVVATWKKRVNAQAAAGRAERTDEYDRAQIYRVANMRRPEQGENLGEPTRRLVTSHAESRRGKTAKTHRPRQSVQNGRRSMTEWPTQMCVGPCPSSQSLATLHRRGVHWEDTPQMLVRLHPIQPPPAHRFLCTCELI